MLLLSVVVGRQSRPGLHCWCCWLQCCWRCWLLGLALMPWPGLLELALPGTGADTVLLLVVALGVARRTSSLVLGHVPRSMSPGYGVGGDPQGPALLIAGP